MTGAPHAHKPPREYRKHGDCYRQRLLKERGIEAIDGRSRPGRIAKTWRQDAIRRKGGKGCPYHVRVQIDAATFDQWRMAYLQGHIIADAHKRGTLVNRRNGKLPGVHDQYEVISARFERRCEALGLDKAKAPNPFSDLSGGLP